MWAWSILVGLGLAGGPSASVDVEVVRFEVGAPAAGASVWMVDAGQLVAAESSGDSLGWDVFLERGRRFVVDGEGVVTLDELPPNPRLLLVHEDRWGRTTSLVPARVVLASRPPLAVHVVDEDGVARSGVPVALESYSIFRGCVGRDSGEYGVVWRGETTAEGVLGIPDPRWFHDHVDYGWTASLSLATRFPESHLAVRVGGERRLLDLACLPEDVTIVSETSGDEALFEPNEDSHWSREQILEMDKDTFGRDHALGSGVVRGRVILDGSVPPREVELSSQSLSAIADLDHDGRFAARAMPGEHWLGIRPRRGGDFPLAFWELTVDADGSPVDVGDHDLRGRLVATRVEVVDRDGDPVVDVECAPDPDAFSYSWVFISYTDRFGRAWVFHPQPIERLRVTHRDRQRWFDEPGPSVRIDWDRGIVTTSDDGDPATVAAPFRINPVLLGGLAAVLLAGLWLHIGRQRPGTGP